MPMHTSAHARAHEHTHTSTHTRARTHAHLHAKSVTISPIQMCMHVLIHPFIFFSMYMHMRISRLSAYSSLYTLPHTQIMHMRRSMRKIHVHACTLISSYTCVHVWAKSCMAKDMSTARVPGCDLIGSVTLKLDWSRISDVVDTSVFKSTLLGGGGGVI